MARRGGPVRGKPDESRAARQRATIDRFHADRVHVTRNACAYRFTRRFSQRSSCPINLRSTCSSARCGRCDARGRARSGAAVRRNRERGAATRRGDRPGRPFPAGSARAEPRSQPSAYGTLRRSDRMGMRMAQTGPADDSTIDG